MTQTSKNNILNPALVLSEVDIERALLGAMLISPPAARQVCSMLRTEDFYDHRHQWVFEAISGCEGEADELTVCERLRAAGRMGEVGEGYIEELVTGTPMSNYPTRISQYAQVVADRAERRRLIDACSDIARTVFDTGSPLAAIYGTAMQRFSESARIIGRQTETMQDVAMAALMAFDDRVERAGKLLGYPCGVNDLDALTAGWQATQLITIAGRPGSGKSVLLAQSSLRAALAGLHTLHFTLEMSAKETMIRLAKNHSLVGYSTGKEHTLSDENKTKLRRSLAQLSELPLSIRTTDSIGQIVAECEIEKRRGKCDMVVIDYLQIAQIDGDTKGDAGTRDAELSKATRLLKRMAMRLEVPVLIGSQLNRQAEGVRPTLSSLRESGGIEADSNVVIGLWQEDPNMQPNIVTASVIKNRDNGIGDVRLFFNKPAHRMADTEKVKVEL